MEREVVFDGVQQNICADRFMKRYVGTRVLRKVRMPKSSPGPPPLIVEFNPGAIEALEPRGGLRPVTATAGHENPTGSRRVLIPHRTELTKHRLTARRCEESAWRTVNAGSNPAGVTTV